MCRMGTEICRCTSRLGAGMQTLSRRCLASDPRWMSETLRVTLLYGPSQCVAGCACIHVIHAVVQMHLCCAAGRLDLVKLLVPYEPDMNIKNFQARTALGEARMYNQQAIVDYIDRCGVERPCEVCACRKLTLSPTAASTCTSS